MAISFVPEIEPQLGHAHGTDLQDPVTTFAVVGGLIFRLR